VATAQSGIFALGTSSHAYLEFDLLPGKDGQALVAAMANLREPRTTIGGVNFVTGFRPTLWRAVAPDAIPAGLAGFDADMVGKDGYRLPATQHDAVLWLSGSAYDVVFDEARQAINMLAGLTTIADETSSWSYRRYRDLTGFIDGTKNPDLLTAPDVAIVADGKPGAGGTVLLLQKWEHDATAWEGLGQTKQEQVIGRSKDESIELAPLPEDSHVAMTDQDQLGTVFRRNMPYGTVTGHGTMFVGFCAEQQPLQTMLESMIGLRSGVRDALTGYTRAASGAYYFIPSIEAIRAFASSQGES
jgi:porphyrinogen peroxidase